MTQPTSQVMSIEMRGIVKRFPGVIANDGIDLEVRQGEIHALLGENGAGKSTLMNVLFGIYAPDEGEIRVNGKPVSFSGARQAVEAGLGMVHQHFMLIPRFTVAENVILGSEGSGIVLDRQGASDRVRHLAQAYGLNVEPDALLGDLPIGLQQRVEILRTLYQQCRVLILDEPTALLTPQEVDDLYKILDRLREDGSTIIFITHKLREVAAISDRVTVIRRGKTVGTRITSETTSAELAELMVGREVLLRVDRPPANPGEPILSLRNVTVTGTHGQTALDIERLDLRRGEILGVCGVEGNGQSELVEVLSGLRHAHEGTCTLGGSDISKLGPNQRRAKGLSYIPEDRHGRGLVLDFPLWENTLLGNTERRPFVDWFRINGRRVREITRTLMTRFDVRAPHAEVLARNLSGGNQQKLIIARELQRDPDALLAIQPTRGLDVGAIEFVHRQLVEARDSGKGVLLISFDLDELLDLSDRIVVMFQGKIIAEYMSGKVSRTELGLAMGGRVADEHIAVAS
jgi:simple sugar transport system ATP-binding protein